jgi:hypothetical protein
VNVRLAKDKMKIVIKENKSKPRVTLYTNPSYRGADIDDSLKKDLPISEFDSSKNNLIGFEPEDKMNSPESKLIIKKMVSALKDGKRLPPIMIRKVKNGFEILDGHHRFTAYKSVSMLKFPVQIVPQREIQITDRVPEED